MRAAVSNRNAKCDRYCFLSNIYSQVIQSPVGEFRIHDSAGCFANRLQGTPQPRRDPIIHVAVGRLAGRRDSGVVRTDKKEIDVCTGRLVDDGVGLLAQELGDVVHREPGLAGRAAALPATEGLDARPGAGRGAGPSVDVQDAGVDLVEEALDLALVLAVDAGRQPVDRVVGEARSPRRATRRPRPRSTARTARRGTAGARTAGRRRRWARRRSRGPCRCRPGARRR